jgi:cell division ATPase FtsA
LAGDVDEEINQPMYSTSIGLIMKGHEEMLKEAKQKVKTPPGEQNEENNDPEDVVEKGKNKPRFLDNLKKTITDIFEENDAKM